MNLKTLLIITLSLGLANCASITGENYQPINLTAKDDKSNSVEGANCV
jgi:starvation-inducible outer membrane lipoprotein